MTNFITIGANFMKLTKLIDIRWKWSENQIMLWFSFTLLSGSFLRLIGLKSAQDIISVFLTFLTSCKDNRIILRYLKCFIAWLLRFKWVWKSQIPSITAFFTKRFLKKFKASRERYYFQPEKVTLPMASKYHMFHPPVSLSSPPLLWFETKYTFLQCNVVTNTTKN